MITNDSSRIIVLGAAQDGGVPQMGCDCRNCSRVRTGDEPVKWVSCIAIVDDKEHLFWIVDATPNFARQYDDLRSLLPDGYAFKGIILTHAHIGHYLGIVYLGKEVLSAVDVPVIATETMCEFLSGNAPFTQLVELNNIRLVPTETHIPIRLSANLSIRLLPVPHRNELSDTVGVQIVGPQASVLYVPDIDDWNQWPEMAAVVSDVSIAIVDGTFYDDGELPNRDRREIPHPTAVETMARFRPMTDSSGLRVYFTHLNHSNCLWTEEAVKAINDKGFDVVRQGDEFIL